jgi:hypothetical protein
MYILRLLFILLSVTGLNGMELPKKINGGPVCENDMHENIMYAPGLRPVVENVIPRSHDGEKPASPSTGAVKATNIANAKLVWGQAGHREYKLVVCGEVGSHGEIG